MSDYVMPQGYRSIEDSRHVSYDLFHVRKRVILYFETDEKTVKIVGYVEKNDPGIFSDQEATQISIICPDPWFYELSAATTIFSGIEAMFEFPFSNESLTEKLIIFGEIKDNIVESFFYRGDVEVGFEAEINFLGPAKRIRIMNLDRREVWEIDTDKVCEIVGIEKFEYGHTMYISTVPGNKYATFLAEGEDFDILNAVKKTSDWPLIYPGMNTYGYTAAQGIENLLFKLTYEVVYEGL